MDGLEIVTAQSDEDWADFAQVDAEGFVWDATAAATAAQQLRGNVHLRLARLGGRVVGCYALASVEQRYGGHAVPAAAVESVTVLPEVRGTGVGAALMADLVRSARERECAVSPLWAAVPRFYARHGWGLGDRSVGFAVRMDALSSMRGEGEAVRDPGEAEWRELWGEIIEPWDGGFAPPPWWPVAGAPEPAEHRFALGWRENDRLTGYARFSQRRSGSQGAVETLVGRFGALTGNAHRGLLGALGGNGGQGETVRFEPGRLPRRNLLHILLSDPHRDRLEERAGSLWLQRIVDVRAALEQRGYAEHEAGVIDLEVRDPHDEHPMRLRCTIESGAMSVRVGGDGTVRIGVAALAAWWGSSSTALQLSRLGLLQSPGDAVALMDRILPRREIWLAEPF